MGCGFVSLDNGVGLHTPAMLAIEVKPRKFHIAIGKFSEMKSNFSIFMLRRSNTLKLRVECGKNGISGKQPSAALGSADFR